jgi:AraC family transcriptional regulator, regulatory protein of adaptative response / methylated-DNA-[protein]-cysteine methyltransferase
MTLMIPRPALRLVPNTRHPNDIVEVISYAAGECALGRVLIARSAGGVCAILIGDAHEELAADLATGFPKAELVADEAVIRDDLARVIHFVDEPSEALYLPLDMRGTAFQRRVWEKLRAIPAGRTVTYMELARWISPLASPRAVAGACAANSIALAVPCHRVVASKVDLTGYRWGIERKRQLIKKEAMI